MQSEQPQLPLLIQLGVLFTGYLAELGFRSLVNYDEHLSYTSHVSKIVDKAAGRAKCTYQIASLLVIVYYLHVRFVLLCGPLLNIHQSSSQE